VPSVPGTPKEFATGLLNTWGVGAAKANNGLVVLLVTGVRRLEMETGYGLEPLLPDGWLGAMQAERMVPSFKAGDYGGGLEAGLAAIDARLRRTPDEARTGTDGAVAIGPSSEGVSPLLGGIGAGIGVLFLLAGALWWRTRPPRCHLCRKPMTQLDEIAEDEHLTTGQKAEERVGSVDWQVFVCDEHRAVKIRPRSAWFTGHYACPGCGFKTAVSSKETLVFATYHSGGIAEVTEHCAHCERRRAYKVVLPRLQRSSSGGGFHVGGGGGGHHSGGGGGGSFGGGHSGGGGAGSSW
jgi:uncharacterized protein